MTGRTASFVFVAVCVVLGVLLLTGFIDRMTTGWVFAAALVILGLTSRGFRRS